MLFSFYFMILFLFSLVSHPVYYCGFLVVNSLLCSLMCYTTFGFSWYPLMFCLIYMGGVYILFIFVSIYSPKTSYMNYLNIDFCGIMFMVFGFLMLSCFIIYNLKIMEFSSFLCTLMEGKFYVIMCLTLLFGFMILSMVMSIKLNYYR